MDHQSKPQLGDETKRKSSLKVCISSFFQFSFILCIEKFASALWTINQLFVFHTKLRKSKAYFIDSSIVLLNIESMLKT